MLKLVHVIRGQICGLFQCARATFTVPWSGIVTYRRLKGPWQELVCAENTREYYANRPTPIPRADNPDF